MSTPPPQPRYTSEHVAALEKRVATAIGHVLRRLRAERAWTRADLVDRFDDQFHIQTIAGYEQGIRNCTVARLVVLCHALGVSASEALATALAEHGITDHGGARALARMADDVNTGLIAYAPASRAAELRARLDGLDGVQYMIARA